MAERSAPAKGPVSRAAPAAKAAPEHSASPSTAAPDVSPGAAVQRMQRAPGTLQPRDVLQLQRTVGNRAAGRMLAEAAIQRAPAPSAARAPASSGGGGASGTGLPESLQSGVEQLSGLSMADTRVHYNSAAPAQVQALAYTKGSDIHVGPGQERHLAHEAWHVVQQKQGRVAPTLQLKSGVAVNDSAGLEHEADVMGAKAASLGTSGADPSTLRSASASTGTMQRAVGFEFELDGIETWAEPEEAEDAHEDEHDGKQEAPAKQQLRKGLVIWHENGFDVTADTHQTISDLEIIIHAMDDRVLGNRAAMGRVFGRVLSFLTQLNSAGSGHASLQASAFRPGPDPSIRLGLAGGVGDGTFQATAGIDLMTLHSIRSGAAFQSFRTGTHPDKDEITGGGSGQAAPSVWQEIQSAMPAMRGALHLASTENTHALEAILSILLTIPITSHALSAPYPKALAGTLMARTDFAALFGMLPANQQTAIHSYSGAFVNTLVTIVHDRVAAFTAENEHPVNVQAGDPVIRSGSLLEPGISDYGGGLTLTQWFSALTRQHARVDLLTARNYPAHLPAKQGEDLESMGAFGGKMDPGGANRVLPGVASLGLAMVALGSHVAESPHGADQLGGAAIGLQGAQLAQSGPLLTHHAVANRPIFEFRSLGRVSPIDLRARGLAFWDYLDIAQGRSQRWVSLSTVTRLWNLASSFLPKR